VLIPNRPATTRVILTCISKPLSDRLTRIATQTLVPSQIFYTPTCALIVYRTLGVLVLDVWNVLLTTFEYRTVTARDIELSVHMCKDKLSNKSLFGLQDQYMCWYLSSLNGVRGRVFR
jgi:hypothetical protein